jgi:hypothetical protein
MHEIIALLGVKGISNGARLESIEWRDLEWINGSEVKPQRRTLMM